MSGDAPTGWSEIDEGEWQTLTEDVDTETWLAYMEAGGTRSFESWRSAPCLTCSSRHSNVEHIYRPSGPVGPPDRERRGNE